MDVKIYIFLISAASCSGLIISGERVPATHWMGGSVGPRAELDDAEKRKFLILPGLELQPLFPHYKICCFAEMSFTKRRKLSLIDCKERR
jgi:hypothetical protein